MAETTTKAKQPSKRGKPNGDVKTNGKAGAPPEAKPDSELIVKLAEMRSQVRDRFGKMVMATMALPRYRHLPISDLRDVIAPDQKSTLSVISNFGQVVTGGSLKLPPLITRLVDEETLEKMGAERMGGEAVKEAT